MTAREFLIRAHRMEARISSKMEQIQRLRVLAEKVTTVYGHDGVSHSRNTDRMADQVAGISDLEVKISDDVGKLIEAKKEIIEVIGQLPEPNMKTVLNMQTVLELRYLDMKSWNEISAIMNRCNTDLFRLHRKALAKVQEILDNRGSKED